jgi:hypothetical protein
MNRVLLTVSAVLVAAATVAIVHPGVVTAQSAASPAITFHKDVLPILQQSCQTCHRPGQIAPMSFLSYDTTRPWARAMKNAVLSKKMPPWFADSAFGHFTNDRSLKADDIETIVKWADAGAPAGDPNDAPPPIDWATDGWQIKPDLIVEGPAYEVPAKGTVEWTWIVVPGGFKEDTWVTSVEVKPSQLAVTHHVCLVYFPHDPNVPYNTPIARTVPRDEEGIEIGRGTPGQAQFPTGSTTFLARGNGIEECYEPGRMPADFRPYGAAKLIPAGTDIGVNVHYTPNGRAVTDHVQIGFTLAKQPPRRRYLALSTSAPQDRKAFAIPPGDPNWQSPQATVTFTRDVELVGLMPHMHVRGKAARFFLDYPDGRTDTILNVPRYDFNWQLWYDTSLEIPKGTKMRVLAWYDNSPDNKFNPNPKATVYYGDQTWEEMHFPSYGVVVDDITLTQKDVVARGGFVAGEGIPAPSGN